MARDTLTTKQRRFVEAYDGNATEAARIAGYKGNDGVLAGVGRENLRKPHIARAICERESERINPAIMNREERQALWSEMARDRELEPRDRLQASKLLGQSEGDFLQRTEHSVTGSLADALRHMAERGGAQ